MLMKYEEKIYKYTNIVTLYKEIVCDENNSKLDVDIVGIGCLKINNYQFNRKANTKIKTFKYVIN